MHAPPSSRPPTPTHDPELGAFDERLGRLRLADVWSGTGALQRLDTHVSTLLFAGERVFKFMRPVHFGFVDFRPLAARQAACVEELRLNRRTAPAWYLGLAVVRDAGHGPVLAPCGEVPGDADGDPHAVLDWALVMRRFDDRQRLDRLAAQGQLTAVQVDALAAALVRF